MDPHNSLSCHGHKHRAAIIGRLRNLYYAFWKGFEEKRKFVKKNILELHKTVLNPKKLLESVRNLSYSARFYSLSVVDTSSAQSYSVVNSPLSRVSQMTRGMKNQAETLVRVHVELNWHEKRWKGTSCVLCGSNFIIPVVSWAMVGKVPDS